MKFLSIGTMVPEQYEVRMSALSNAGNRFLWNLTNELCRCGNEVQRVSYLGIPVEAEVRKDITAEHDSGIEYVWKSPRIFGGILCCHRVLVREMKDSDCLLAYNVVYAWLLAPFIAHVRHKKAILILADYSDVDSFQNSLRKMYARVQRFVMRRYDIVVGLSENTEKILRNKQKFLLLEGGISREFYDSFQSPDIGEDSIVVMYAGILEKVTGIDMLLEAFKMLEDPNVRLFISGKGSMEAEVRSAQQADPRICYLGCPVYEEYIQNLHKADVLVNPRNMNLPENRNNFPSKIMEYLATGKPILSTRFPGWERFAKQIRFCDSECEDMKFQLVKLCNNCRQEQEVRYRENRVFARKYLWSEQVKKIMENK